MPPEETSSRPISLVNRIVAFALQQRMLVLLLAVGLAAAGVWAYNTLPMDAYPNLSPPMVDIVTQWPGHSSEEVERLITVPVELGLNAVPGMVTKRSISLYGLSDVTLTFADGTDPYFARQRVRNRLPDVSLPDGVSSSMSPMSPPSGLVYRYVLQSTDRSPMELKTLNDWVVAPQYRAIPGVADDSGFGGGTMQYQVLLDPMKIASLGMSVAQVEAALAANNSNAGGGFYSQGGQFFYVRGLGRLETVQDIGNVVLAVHDGTPVLVSNVGTVKIGIAPRLGEFGYMNQDDAVEGVVLSLTGAKTENVLQQVEAKTTELNSEILPRDVKVHAFYDLTDLIQQTKGVVMHNLLLGMLLVIAVLIFFLYDIRAGLIVAVTVPLALLFAFLCLDLKGASANLLSIGAIDFGILVDGAIFMVENIFRELAARKGTEFNIREVIQTAASEVDRPLVYAVAVIVASFLPIYVLTGPSGTLFKPMADTMIFALVGSLLVTLTLLPVLCALLMRRGVTERRNAIYEKFKAWYVRGLERIERHAWRVTGASMLLLVLALVMMRGIGAEFMPHLDEGSLWVRATMPYTISFDEASKISPQIRKILGSFPVVTTVTSELGRPDDGTDSTGFFNDEFFVGLKPYSQWGGQYHSKQDLIAAIDKKLAVFPGIQFNYSQPAEDAVDEAETGLKSALAVKIYGPDLHVLQDKGKAIKQVMQKVRGITDLTLVHELGQPNLAIKIDRAKIARYGINVDDINKLIEAAIGGDVATQVAQGEKQFDLLVRLDPKYRDNPQQIGNIPVATPGGQQIPLKELADISVANGASFIYRENGSRYIGVQYSVTGRDLAGAVNDAIKQVAHDVKLPRGYRLEWGGEYQEYTASRAQMNVILPLTLLLIFGLLFVLYGNFKFPFITVVGVLLSAPFGAILAMWLTGTSFSVSSAIGFIVLFGVSVLTGVVYISCVNELRLSGMEIGKAIHEAAVLRLRPITMTALVAALGLLPAAIASGVGTDSQRPFALVIVAGMLSRLLIGMFLMPALYALVARNDDHLQV
ncbi:CusA/CzcA family heavy metal efflux RND transporter [Rhodanobacter sp. AS-Z3]|uniref:efflux RND transporter permease subunit n=1 Tax=Rhodanobacter sp. AS-Z3 TaxID=3031330 RepID=UPI0024790C73|nr:CusA/CzcA family heavy metal efflux RND transporter [Rhodanobacter sp. AS-Z3]WEN16022.1 CusA/CzcA family heavy metal efflux RND transporter [Rhodanobacter sp. AS-Z3]